MLFTIVNEYFKHFDGDGLDGEFHNGQERTKCLVIKSNKEVLTEII
jgi:hypothetical protein